MKYVPVNQVKVPTEIPLPFIEFLDTLNVDVWNLGQSFRAAVKTKKPAYYVEAQQFIDKCKHNALYKDKDYKMADKLWCVSAWLEAYAIIHANVDYAIDGKVLASMVDHQTKVLTQSEQKFSESKPISWTFN